MLSNANGFEIRVWDISAESWIARACGIANRNLTKEEWSRFLRMNLTVKHARARVRRTNRDINIALNMISASVKSAARSGTPDGTH